MQGDGEINALFSGIKGAQSPLGGIGFLPHGTYCVLVIIKYFYCIRLLLVIRVKLFNLEIIASSKWRLGCKTHRPFAYHIHKYGWAYSFSDVCNIETEVGVPRIERLLRLLEESE